MSASEVIRLTVSLVLVVGGLVVVRRWSRGGRPARRANGGVRVPVRIVGRAGINRGASVAVIDVADRRFLVGAGERGVNLLAELSPGPGVPGSGAGRGSVEHLTLDDVTGSTPTDDDLTVEDGSDDDLLHEYSDALTDLSPSSRPRMGLVARLQQSTLRTSATSRPRGRPL
jgi:flagellar biogenesis protein FliO